MKIISTLFLAIASFTALYPQQSIQKIMEDKNDKYTNVGNIGITITNFGTYGHGFSKWPGQPSCEYPLGSGIEHIFDGGLYIGGFLSSDSLGSNKLGPFVTTGAVDAASVSTRGGGFEWTNDAASIVDERSTLLTSRFFSPNAISHQDFVAEYLDTNKVLSNGEVIEGHSPLGLKIRQESYAWNYPFANFFVIMNYWIKNISNKYVDSIYVGLWTDAVVRNTKVSPPTGSNFFNKGGNGFEDSLSIAYEFDATGDIGLTDSYIGIQFLGANQPYDSVNFVSWQFRNTSDPNFFAPQDDNGRYEKLRGYFGGTNRYGFGVLPSSLKSPSNRSLMISAGPYKKLAPGDSLNVVFAFVAAKKYGTSPAAYDSLIQRKNLHDNAQWALRAYYGEDRNRNNLLDAGEDGDGNGVITRYILPTPPSTPRVKAVPADRKVTIYWDRNPENSTDPISGKKDFEGYRVYRTNTGFDLTESQNIQSDLIRFSEFDSTGNTTGYNTGFNAVTLSEPKMFAGDTTKYNYKIEVDNLLNGWQYIFSVTAFDKRDEENNIESLESAPLANLVRVIPGSLPTSNPDVEIGVYPNPYYGNAYWDGKSERLRKLYFYNLPERCDIYIYTLSGDIVKKINHDQASNGSDLRWFENYATDGKQQMSGGEHAWDLITDNDQAVATGLYLFTVKNLDTGDIKTGKFLIIK